MPRLILFRIEAYQGYGAVHVIVEHCFLMCELSRVNNAWLGQVG